MNVGKIYIKKNKWYNYNYFKEITTDSGTWFESSSLYVDPVDSLVGVSHDETPHRSSWYAIADQWLISQRKAGLLESIISTISNPTHSPHLALFGAFRPIDVCVGSSPSFSLQRHLPTPSPHVDQADEMRRCLAHNASFQSLTVFFDKAAAVTSCPPHHLVSHPLTNLDSIFMWWPWTSPRLSLCAFVLPHSPLNL